MNEDSSQVQELPRTGRRFRAVELEINNQETRDQTGTPIQSSHAISQKFTQTSASVAASLNVDAIKRFALLIFGDVAAVLICTVFSWSLSVAVRQLLNADPLDAQLLTRQLSIEVFFLIPVCVIVTFSAYWGHYTQGKPIWNEQLEILKTSAFAIVAGLIFLYLSKQHVSRLWLLSFWLCVPVLIPLVRNLLKKLMMDLDFWYRPMIVIGTGRNSEATAAMLQSEPLMGYKILSFINIGIEGRNSTLSESRTVHGLNSRSDIQRRFGKVDVLFAMDTVEEIAEQKTLIDDFICNSSVRIMVSPPLNGLPLYGADIISVFKHDNIFLSVRNNSGNLRHKWTKRGFDVCVSIILMLVLSPLLVLLYCIIKIDRGPGFYASKRVGYGGKIFGCFKFRSMAVNSSELLTNLLESDQRAREEWNRDFKLECDPRVTRIGRFIRRTSLDELPQLWNVLTGDMSLVGPRPILPDELEQYGENIKYYNVTRPGITGLWQVSGRNSLDYSQRIELNLWYTKNWSLWNDIIILLKTIPIAAKGSGAY